MFNLQGSELIIILLLALVVLGPEKLPDAMRKLGQFYAELKKMSSGFQQEFRSVVDEPLKEMRDTANLLRDSADFTKFQEGERAEKPKSADMAAADPTAVPTDDVPFTDAVPAAEQGDPDAAVVDPEPPRPRPFSGDQLSSAAPRPVAPTPFPAPPLPFARQAPLPPDRDEHAGTGAGDSDVANPFDDATIHDRADVAATDAESIAVTADEVAEPGSSVVEISGEGSESERDAGDGDGGPEVASDEASAHDETDPDAAEDRAG